MSERVVIVGAGQAGVQGAISLRQSGFAGMITMIGAESALPYQRPPLSKEYLRGELAEERLYLRAAEFFERQGIETKLGARVQRIDRAKKQLLTDSHETFAYDKLLLATGAPPKRLGGVDNALEGLYYLRTLRDSDDLRRILSCEGRVLIVGAGYIGLEVAAVARKAGRDVTVIEAAERVLSRVAGAPISDFYQNLHRSAGVDLRLGCALGGLMTERGKVVGAELMSGERVDCSAALVGIGAVPEEGLARDAGLEVANGVLVDEHARTSDVHIWAAGDCANFPSPFYGRRMRLESVPHAIEQAKIAATNMVGGEAVYDALPWFWSDQYDVKLQTAGLSEGHDSLIVRGLASERKFSVWYLKDDVVLAADAINDPGAFMAAKRIIAKKAPVDPNKLADPGVVLTDIGR